MWGSLIAAAIMLFGNYHKAQAQWTTNVNDVYKTNTAGNVGIGTASPTQGKLVLSDAAQSAARLVLNGQEFYAAGNTDTNGLALLLGVNRTGNRQLWIADSAALAQNSSNTVVRIFPNAAVIDAIATDATAKQLQVGNGAGVYVPGNVGIGTTSPTNAKVEIKLGTGPSDASMYGLALSTTATNFPTKGRVASSFDGLYLTQNAYYNGSVWAVDDPNRSTAKIVLSSYVSGESSIMFATAAANNVPDPPVRMTIDKNGKVGIGITTPAYNLHVIGDGRFTGNLSVDGNIAAKYQDVAEWVPASGQLPAGTVVVLDTTKTNQVVRSTESYDTRVAGVVSEQPGIALGESGKGKVLVATTGRVLVEVDAMNDPIHIGDLLVTSDVPGLAMKSEPILIGNRKFHTPGTLIGKALEPLEKGSGKILVLLSLQ